MRILTYKRTHIGDPDAQGRFGINDCMGRLRSLPYDAVIGVGGQGSEARTYGIDRKINWVGIEPTRIRTQGLRRAEVVTFKHFVLFEEMGPYLHTLAPALAKRMYAGRRFVFNSYTEQELTEALSILQLAIALPEQVAKVPASVYRRMCRRRNASSRKKRCRVTPNPSIERTCPDKPGHASHVKR